jgi:hypothetical protein
MQQIQSDCVDAGKHDTTSRKYSTHETFTKANGFSDTKHEIKGISTLIMFIVE